MHVCFVNLVLVHNIYHLIALVKDVNQAVEQLSLTELIFKGFFIVVLQHFFPDVSPPFLLVDDFPRDNVLYLSDATLVSFLDLIFKLNHELIGLCLLSEPLEHISEPFLAIV